MAEDTPAGHLRRALEALGQAGADPLKLRLDTGTPRQPDGAPAWNCVSYPGEGMHLWGGGGVCEWCGVLQALAISRPDPGPQPCLEARGVCGVCGRQLIMGGLPVGTIPPHAQPGGARCTGTGTLPVAWRMPGGGPVPAALRRDQPQVTHSPQPLAHPGTPCDPDRFTAACGSCAALVEVLVWEPGGPATAVCAACGLACTWSYDPRED